MRALPPPPQRPEPARGQGEGAPDPDPRALSVWEAEGFTRNDARTVRQAMRGRWPMSEEMRARIVETLALIATGQVATDGRTLVAAAKCLVEADKVNLEVEAGEIRRPDMVEAGGTTRVDFSKMTDAEVEAFIERGGA